MHINGSDIHNCTRFNTYYATIPKMLYMIGSEAGIFFLYVQILGINLVEYFNRLGIINHFKLLLFSAK